MTPQQARLFQAAITTALLVEKITRSQGLGNRVFGWVLNSALAARLAGVPHG